MPALGASPIVPIFRPPGGETNECSKAPSREGGLAKPIIATSYDEESSIVRGAIQPSPALDGQKPGKSTHTVINGLKKLLGVSTSKVPAWQLYKE